MPEYKRRRYVVKRIFQIRYTVIVLLFILLTVFLAGAIIYYTVFPYLSDKLADVYPQSRLVSILANANLRLFYGLAALVPIAIWMSIALSHRIAGPWYRLENILLDMSRGDITEEIIKLRKDDELKSLADAINKVTARLWADKTQSVKQLDILQKGFTNLQDELNRELPDPERARQLISKLQSSVSSLKSITA